MNNLASEYLCPLLLHKGYFKLDFFIHCEELCMVNLNQMSGKYVGT